MKKFLTSVLVFSQVGFINKMGLVATKPVFGVSDKASFKPVSSATETQCSI